MAKFLDSAGLERLWEKVKAYVDSHAGGGLPSGCIVVWSGAADAIPSGWALCDGNNGTPDLRGRFVLGAGSTYAVGATGGEETHKLTTSEMPSHSHSIVKVSINPSATTYFPNTTKGNGGNDRIYTNSAGSSAAHNNMPPYYALCYIMKL